MEEGMNEPTAGWLAGNRKTGGYIQEGRDKSLARKRDRMKRKQAT
jgi:hypothetical protein